MYEKDANSTPLSVSISSRSITLYNYFYGCFSGQIAVTRCLQFDPINYWDIVDGKGIYDNPFINLY
jgi:hypothetical protein